MNLKEMQELLLEAMQNPDKAPANVKAVMEEMKVNFTTLETQTAKITEQEKRIRDLQDTNMKLFLNQTVSVNEQEEVEPENPVKTLLNNYMKGE